MTTEPIIETQPKFTKNKSSSDNMKASIASVTLFIFLVISLTSNYFQLQTINGQSKENTLLQENFSNLQTEFDSKTNKQAVINSTKKEDSKNSLLRRCGDLPNEAPGSNGHWTIVTGPEWASDCRHIAWGVWESGTGWLGKVDSSEVKPKRERPLANEGIYLYKDGTKEIIKIYTPDHTSLANESSPETPEFVKWQNSKTIIFKVDGQVSKSIDINSLEIKDIPTE